MVNASTSVSFKPSSEFSHPDTVLVGKQLWDKLKNANTDATAGSIALSIAPLSSAWAAASRPPSSPLSSLLCWAKPGEEDGLVVPSDWIKRYDRVFSSLSSLSYNVGPSHILTPVNLITLSEVIVQAHTTGAYTAATSDTEAFEAWLCRDNRILRQRSSYSVPATEFAGSTNTQDDALLKFRVLMTGPVMQGVAHAGQTTFVLLPPPREEPHMNGHAEPVPSGLSTPSTEGWSAEGDVEIDENFLSSSLLEPPLASQLDGQSAVSPRVIGFTVEPLAAPISPATDGHTVYVRTVDLSRLGLLDADWAILRTDSSSSGRVVSVRACDDVAPDVGTLRASPVLLHNLTKSPSRSQKVYLQPLPEILRTRTLPTAQSVTIARVASKISVNKLYQPLVLDALKAYFGAGKRLVRQGDLLVLKIDLQQAHLQSTLPEGEQLSGLNGSRSASSKEELVYFAVTNVEFRSQMNGHATHGFSELSVGFGSGELGCWVDASETRMVQTGIEHSRVPDASAYMGLQVLSSEGEARNNALAYAQMHGLASAALVKNALSYDLPVSFLLKGARGIGKARTVLEIARQLGLHPYELDCYDLLGDTDAKTEGILRARFEQVASCSPCALILRNLDAFAQSTQAPEPGNEPAIINVLKDLLADFAGSWRLSGYPILVFGTTAEPARVPFGLLNCFKHEVEFNAPDENERAAILASLLATRTLAPDVLITDLARKTAAFVAGDLVSLVNRTDMAAIARTTTTDDATLTPDDIFAAGLALSQSDFDLALDDARSAYSANIGAPKIPNVSWDDVGGLGSVKADILDTIQLPLERPDLFASDLKKRSGILLYGPPGTGKTLLAKAVATSFSLNFFSVKGPELLNMYIGESEANVRRVFQRARDARPCVVFFDELDSVAPKRGAHGDSGGVMDRIVSQLLAELDGIASGKGGDVFVIGATNRPDLLDPALLRPGRFDRMLYLGVSDTHIAQLRILQALTRRFKLAPTLDLAQVAERCPFNFTGADFYALCTDALLKAMTRTAGTVDAKLAKLNASGEALPGHPFPLTPQYFLSEMATPEDVEVQVSQEDFEAALSELQPSVSAAEMAHYAKIQERFSRKPEERLKEEEEDS
ncbi:AAA-domain-containing protein [Peniophora sp. CONT]|nr:AAA-domain-containing protein [Peniophora sp. CONT]